MYAHGKTLSRDLTHAASYSQKRIGRSLSINSSPHAKGAAVAVSTVRRQLKTIVDRVTELSKGKSRGSGVNKVGDLLDACSRLETNLDSVLREQANEEVTSAPANDVRQALQIIEESLLSHFRIGTNIAKLKAAVTEAFSRVRAHCLPGGDSSNLVDSFNVAKLNQDLSDLRDANSELSTLNEDLLKELTESTEANKQLMEMLTKLQREKVKLHREVVELKNARQQLRSKLREVQDLSIGELQNESIRLPDSLDDMYKSIDGQSFQVDLIPDASELQMTISDLRSQLLRANSEVQSLRTELNQTKSALLDSNTTSQELQRGKQAAEALLATLRSENERLKTESGSSGNAAALRGETSALQTQCRQLSEEKQSIAAALQQSEHHVSELKSLLDAAQSQLALSRYAKTASATLVQSLSELEQTVLKLQRENTEAKGELVTVKREHEELLETLAQFQAEKTRLVTVKGSLAAGPTKTLKEGKRESLQEMQDKVTALEERVEALTQERDQLLAKQHSDSLSEVRQLQEDLEKLRLENKELAAVVKQVQVRTLEMQNSEFKTVEEAKQHLIILTHRLAGAEATNTMLRKANSLEPCEHSPVPRDEEPLSVPKEVGGQIVEELKDALKAKEEVADRLSEELSTLKSSFESMKSEYEDKLKTLADDNDALQATYEDLEKFFATMEKRYLAQIDNYKMEIETKSALFREQITASVKKITELKREIERLTKNGACREDSEDFPHTAAAPLETLGSILVCKHLRYQNDSWWLLSRDSAFLWVRHSALDLQLLSEVFACDAQGVAVYALQECDTERKLACLEQMLSNEF